MDSKQQEKIKTLDWRLQSGYLNEGYSDFESVHILLGRFIADRHSPNPLPNQSLLQENEVFEWGKGRPLEKVINSESDFEFLLKHPRLFRHAISITTSENLIVCTVELYNSETEIPVKIKKANAQDAQFLREIQQKLREEFSKRFYIQRGMRLFSDTQIHICKSPRLIDWTQTQAMYDSDDIIAEMLNRRNY
jgi:hypothetical protein